MALTKETMMCFGMQQTQATTQNFTPNAAVSGAANTGISTAEGLVNRGFTPYGGNQVAGFSPQQASSFGLGNTLAEQTAGYGAAAPGIIGGAATSGPSTVNTSPIWSQMSPYMNQYVAQALRPQIQAQDIQFAAQNAQNNAAATSSGAFGDARAGIQQANTGLMQDIARQGLLGQAYTSAFNTAIGAGAQDVSNSLSAQTATGQLSEAAKNRAMAGGGQLAGLGFQGVGLQNTLGGQQTAQQQAQLNAAYNQWLMSQQYPFLSLQALNQTTQTGAQAMPPNVSGTTSAPNNSGLVLLGSLGGAVLGNAGLGQGVASAMGMFSDERVKENIEKVGELADETPVYTFQYKFDPLKTPRLGLMAQDVEKQTPEAVKEFSGIKMVDYKKATEKAASIERRKPGLDRALPMAA